MNKREEILSTMSVGKALVKLALPSIAAMLINMVYSMTDTFFIGQLNDTTAMAAIMVVMPILLILGSLGTIFGTGAAVIISMALGRKNSSEVSNTFITSILSSIIVSVIVCILCSIFPIEILRLFGASEMVLDSAVKYARIIFIGNFFTIMNNVLSSLVRSEGATNVSTIGMVIGAVINIILDPIFIFVFNMGISGAALATLLGAIASAIYYVLFFVKGNSELPLNLKGYSYAFSQIKKIVTLGLPSALTTILMSLSFSLFNILGSKYGDVFIASMGLSTRIISFAIMILIGISTGYQPIAGYCYGARNHSRLRLATIYTLAASTFISVISYLGIKRFSHTIISLFSDIPEIISESEIILNALSWFLPIMGIIITVITLFTALGKATESLIIALTRQAIILLPAMFIMPLFLGKYGLIYAQPLADVCSFVVCLVLLIRLPRTLKSNNITI